MTTDRARVAGGRRSALAPAAAIGSGFAGPSSFDAAPKQGDSVIARPHGTCHVRAGSENAATWRLEVVDRATSALKHRQELRLRTQAPPSASQEAPKAKKFDRGLRLVNRLEDFLLAARKELNLHGDQEVTELPFGTRNPAIRHRTAHRSAGVLGMDHGRWAKVQQLLSRLLPPSGVSRQLSARILEDRLEARAAGKQTGDLTQIGGSCRARRR